MSIDVEKRRNQLKNLRDFITDARKKIVNITKELQWDISSLDHKKEMVCCPFDAGHIVPKTILQSHVERCKLSQQGYHPEDIPFPPSAVDLNAPNVLKVDKTLQASILWQAREKNPIMLRGYPGSVDDRDVPMTSDRFMSSFTSDERSAIHSYVISNTVSPSEGKDISLLEQDLEKNFQNKKEEKRDKTALEKLIEERDAKRRKEGKKVHINRKSHTEIIREVIENQMEIYMEWLQDENLIKKEEGELDQVEVSDNQSEGEIIDCDVKPEFATRSGPSDSVKSFDDVEKKQKCWDYGSRKRNYQSWEHDAHSESWRRNDAEKYRESRSKGHHSRDSGSKRYWDYGTTSYKDNERRNFKEYDYKKTSGKYIVEDKTDYRLKKYGSEKYWEGGAYVKEHVSSDEEGQRDKTRKRHASKSDSEKKRVKEKRHHKSRRRHHCDDSNSDNGSQYKK